MTITTKKCIGLGEVSCMDYTTLFNSVKDCDPC